MKHMPTATLPPVKHGDYFAINGQLLKWNALTQRGELILNINEYLAEKELAK